MPSSSSSLLKRRVIKSRGTFEGLKRLTGSRSKDADDYNDNDNNAPPPPPPPSNSSSKSKSQQQQRSQASQSPASEQQQELRQIYNSKQQDSGRPPTPTTTASQSQSQSQQQQQERPPSRSSRTRSDSQDNRPSSRNPSLQQQAHSHRSSQQRSSSKKTPVQGRERSNSGESRGTNTPTSHSSRSTDLMNNQHPISKRNQDTTNNNNNSNNNSISNSNSMTGGSGSINNMSSLGVDLDSKLSTIRQVYGPSANIYTDVLKVSPTATPSEIREAFFCLRYDIYQKLNSTVAVGTSGDENGGVAQGGAPGAEALTSDERKEVEAQMDAITGAFHVLSDGGRRAKYDASLVTSGGGRSVGSGAQDGSVESGSGEMDDTGVPVSNHRGTSAGRKAARNNSASGTTSVGEGSPSKLSPPKSDNIRMPIGQRRSVFRRRAAQAGMNESRQAVAKPVTGGLNTRPSPSEVSSDSGRKSPSGRTSPRWTDFGNDGMIPNTEGAREMHNARDGRQGYPQGNGVGWAEGGPLPAGVDNLNAREQMLYKNQMYLSQQKQQQQQNGFNASPTKGANSRLGSRYDTHERGDKYAEGHEGVNNPAANLASPTGVENFDNSNNAWGRKVKHAGVSNEEVMRSGNGSHGHSSHNNRRSSPTTTTDSNMTEEDDDVSSLNPLTKTEEGTEVGCDDDELTRASSMYGDDDGDTRTYDDETTTLGETVDDNTTIGESTWASYEDDATMSYATNNTRDNIDEGGKYSPGHKKGNKPAPILKQSSGVGGVNRTNSEGTNGGKRVTIHSHRGRGEREDDEFSLFEGAMCPTIPSLTMIQEEVNGTYKDFTQALHQVSNAFVISPDDIDRLADKIRDAKIELGENYAKQVQERVVGIAGAVSPKQLGNTVGQQQKKKPKTKPKPNNKSASKRPLAT